MFHIISSLMTVYLSFPDIYLQHLLYQTNCHMTLFKQKNRKNLQSVDLKKVFRRSFFMIPEYLFTYLPYLTETTIQSDSLNVPQMLLPVYQ